MTLWTRLTSSKEILDTLLRIALTYLLRDSASVYVLLNVLLTIDDKLEIMSDAPCRRLLIYLLDLAYVSFPKNLNTQVMVSRWKIVGSRCQLDHHVGLLLGLTVVIWLSLHLPLYIS